jgi:pentatricopeptide repeat protein
VIKESLYNEILEYCKLNNIEDVEGLINKMLERGFQIEKYGETPIKINNEIVKEKIVYLNNDEEVLKMNDIIKDKDNEIEKYKVMVEELKEELNKIKNGDDDIYNEEKKGIFGSNIMDLWKKKK